MWQYPLPYSLFPIRLHPIRCTLYTIPNTVTYTVSRLNLIIWAIIIWAVIIWTVIIWTVRFSLIPFHSYGIPAHSHHLSRFPFISRPPNIINIIWGRYPKEKGGRYIVVSQTNIIRNEKLKTWLEKVSELGRQGLRVYRAYRSVLLGMGYRPRVQLYRVFRVYGIGYLV